MPLPTTLLTTVAVSAHRPMPRISAGVADDEEDAGVASGVTPVMPPTIHRGSGNRGAVGP
jgi:hypothetical protein